MLHFLRENINRLILSLFIASGYWALTFSQTAISGIINKYGKVNSVGTDYVIINNPEQFANFQAGDTVLLIQMKGGISIVDETSQFGLIQDTIGSPGRYEFLIISSVVPAQGRINFRNNCVNSYSAGGDLQLVRVPSFNTAIVNAELTCQAWDSISGTGGVLAFIVARSLHLNANINVNGKGFKGGATSTGTGICVGSNPAGLDRFGFDASFQNSGFKGEGPVSRGIFNLSVLYPIFPNYSKGKGNNFTGGGGGNGRFSGGGGGSNYGTGGRGGLEVNTCSPNPEDGGIGGRQIKFSNVNGGIFAGGGGGSSTYLTGATPSPGGNGGGIIFIICDTIKGNNRSVTAEGSKPVQALGNAGSGGGGGGGSIALYTRSYFGSGSSLTVSAKGGNGGDNAGTFGEGGGGGGGLVWLKAGQLPPNVTVNIAGGLPGARTGASTAQSGNAGESTNFVPVLTGFLYNSIHSSVTGNQTDSICSGNHPQRINGTMPVGGIPPYNYRWEKSYNLVNWTTLYNGPDSVNYTPAETESATVFFRRTVTDSDAVPLTDVSKPVQIIVHPYIKNNIIGYNEIICYGQNASELISIATLQDGNGHYSFTWEKSPDNSSYTVTATGTENYLPPPELTRTTWYRRVVNSARCVDISSPVVITVLDTIRNNNILAPSQEICDGMLFSNLSGTVTPVLAGGDNTFRFRWENSTDGLAWNSAPGINNLSDYNPYENEPLFTGNEFFRRVVLSGSGDVCANISKPVHLTKYPVITNNTISGGQTICQGETPLQITGSVPLNGKGAGSYTYTWQDSTRNHTWTDIPGHINISAKDFNPPPLFDTTGFRRIVYSSACTDISEPVIINVHASVTGNSISLLTPGLADTTLCYGGIPHRITGSIPGGGTGIPGDFAYQWYSSPDNINWTVIEVSGTSRDYQPGALTSTTFFRRKVISGECSSESSPVRISILPVITGNAISGTQAVCINTSPDPLIQAAGTSLSGGAGSGSYTFLWEESTDGVNWSPAPGINNASNGNYQPPALSVPMKYRRIVYSGANNCCSSISNVVEISIDILPEGASINAGPDTTINTFDYMIQMVADPVFQGATGKWTLIEGSGSFSNENSNTTRITGLSKGINRFLWTVTSGACKLEDMVEVRVYDMFIPEGFSPNDDSYNNRFIIKGLDLQNQTAELKIINGAGTIVYSTSNLNNNDWEDWDGKNNRGIDLPEGTYYYLLRIESKGNSQVFKKSGFVVLKRF